MSISKKAVLGTLVHRAVLMPFAKPKELHQLGHGQVPVIDRRWDGTAQHWTGESVTGAIKGAVCLLRDAMGEPICDYRESARWRAKLELVADAGGAWWSGPAHDFRSLEPEDREWVSARLAPAAENIAKWFEETAKKEDWKWAWSEVPLWNWATPLPKITRIDLLVAAGEGGARGYAFDLKVTSRAYDTDDFKPNEKDRDSLRRYRTALEGTSFPGSGRDSLALLYADPEGKRKPYPFEIRLPRW